MPATYEKIATTTLGTASATITFSTIPATYTDLRVVFVAKSSGFANVFLRFNGDTGTNYSNTYLYGTGSSAASARASNQAQMMWALYGTSNTHPNLYAADIFSYAGSTNKTVLLSPAEDDNGAGYAGVLVGLWRDTTAINSVTITSAGAATFDAGSIATLYGILKA